MQSMMEKHRNHYTSRAGTLITPDLFAFADTFTDGVLCEIRDPLLRDCKGG